MIKEFFDFPFLKHFLHKTFITLAEYEIVGYLKLQYFAYDLFFQRIISP